MISIRYASGLDTACAQGSPVIQWPLLHRATTGPEAPYRQWVLTFPWELRFLLAMDRTFLTEMLRVFQRTLFAWQRLRGRRAGIRDGRPGAVTFVQRFGSVLNLRHGLPGG